jgi:very-short-patch-repair endonuclease
MRKLNIDKEEFMHQYLLNDSDGTIAEKFNTSRSVINRFRKSLGLKPNRNNKPKHSDESRKLMSVKRKEWLAQNPDKHPWRNKDKFQSVPCQKVKEFLNNQGVLFVGEFNPQIPDRFFSIDIALPDKKIALEINGNQHYQRDGTLQPYYQTRHDLLVSHGWKVYELHYSSCFYIDKLQNLLHSIKNSECILDFDYFHYSPIKTKPKKLHFCICGKEKASKRANQCMECRKKVKNRPSKEELEKLIN